MSMSGPKNKKVFDKNKLIAERLVNIEDFLTELHAGHTRLVEGVQKGIDQLQFVNSKTAEVVEGIVTALGEDFKTKLNDAIKVNKAARDERVAAVQKQQVADAVKANKLKSVDTVSELCLIVGREIKDDKVVPPGYIQEEWAKLDESLKPQLLGKTVGTIVTTLTGSAFEVTEVYEPVYEEVPATPPTESK